MPIAKLNKSWILKNAALLLSYEVFHWYVFECITNIGASASFYDYSLSWIIYRVQMFVIKFSQYMY